MGTPGQHGLGRNRTAAFPILVGLLLGSCAPTPEPRAARTPTAEGPSPAVPASPSPADVAGGVATVEVEAEVARFEGRITRLPGGLREEMRGTTWKPGCPVALSDLRLLHVGYWGFDGESRRGPMIVHEDAAEDVVWVFGRLFRARFPIKRVGPTREFVPEEFEPRISSARSVTAAFNCRPVITPRGPLDELSNHSYGWAIDINPVQNPFVTADGFVRNVKSRRYLDRSKRLPGMIHDGDIVVRSFSAIGWSWGGHWAGGKDYMHFDRPAA
jgi:hypothetical protein